ncbi:sigma-70 family RNA polymerase sigma factor [Lacunimicrobium album]
MSDLPPSQRPRTLMLELPAGETEQSAVVQQEFLEQLEGVSKRLYYYLLALTSNPDDAEDVLQDCYEIAWRKFEEYERGTNFYHWISRIAFNQARNFNRRRRKHRGMGLSDQMLVDLAKMQSGYSELFELRQQQLKKCLGQLNSTDRQMLLSSYQGNVSRAQLAKENGMDADLFYKKLFRLRRKLFDCINRHLGLEGVQ